MKLIIKVRNCILYGGVFLMFLIGCAAPVWAALEADDIDVYVQGDRIDAINDEDDEYRVQSNLVDIEVDNFPRADTVTIGGKEAEPDGHDWVVEDFELSPGENKITVQVDNESVDITIHYVDAAAPDSLYRVADISDQSEIEVFDGELKLELGKNVILDKGRDEIADEQYLDISIYDHEYIRSRFNYVPASKLYRISAADEDYTLLNDGRLTLKHNVKNIGRGLDTLTVLWFKDYDGKPNWSVYENLGGTVNRDDNTITVTLPKNGFGFYGVFNVVGNFNDFYMGNENVRWSYTYVMPLYAKGIMEPLNPGSGSFGLVTWDGREQPITQGEFATMLSKAMELPYRKITGYNRDYYHSYNHSSYITSGRDPYVEASASHGLLNGLHFSPNNILSREQAAVMVVRAANLKIYDDLDIINRITKKIYTDADSISPWAKPYVYACYRTKFMRGAWDPNHKYRYRFNPHQPLTRAQAAKIVYELIIRNNQDAEQNK
ncbi:hypothetical protein JOC37_000409 [Desulfohalotomaculum tongense]|uniref:S-layer homology domain-containing protein n=1 Tax=Desulforadius tongensis TaxID=1216062 RepID=UPI001956F7BA|nr:S-layer homology domain-containing protein [Desulforadius tongensis]MBM7854037.1 hypothetical protein [Desulforadius tongensis]